jgi:hypothetical protein
MVSAVKQEVGFRVSFSFPVLCLDGEGDEWSH